MGKFITDQILGMKWLNTLIGNLLGTLGLDVTSRIGGSIQFFLYDVIKITVLLCVLIYLISYIQSYFPPERSKKIMGRFHGIWANCIAALLGTVTPFCSCSSIPLFIGFTSAGLPLGVTFSFLISSPIKILGGGCAKCNALEAATEEALRELGMDATIDHVRDFEKIAAYGVMTTPALVVDGQVVSYGKVLKKDEVISILKKVRA